MTLRRVALTASVVLTVVTLAIVPLAHESPAPAFAAPHENEAWPVADHEAQAQRDAALRRAAVWRSSGLAAASRGLTSAWSF